MRSDLGYARACGVAVAGVAAAWTWRLIGIGRAAATGYGDPIDFNAFKTANNETRVRVLLCPLPR